MRTDATRICNRIAAGLCVALTLPTLAQEGPQPEPGERLRFVQTPWSAQADTDVQTPPGYCDQNCATWIISYSAAYETEAFDQGITLSYNQFLVDNIEGFVEGGLWSFYDRGADAAYGLSLGIGFRWHFLTRERWTLFADLGISVLGTTDAVPPEGTQLNFMPRAGVGFTRQLDEHVRLIGGLRWHHISNARTRGDSRNPARDAPQVYVGLVVPF
jgi:hypothetical protein